MTSPNFGLRFYSQIFRVPNRWRLESSGRLIRDLETDEHRAMVAYVRQLYDAGIFYPGTATMTTTQAKTTCQERLRAVPRDMTFRSRA